jgi:hypothetical protein
MRLYEQVTIESVQLASMTVWRVVGWITKKKPLTLAYFSHEEGAKKMKAIMEMARDPQHAPSKPGKR